jgi:hypothetical protein
MCALNCVELRVIAVLLGVRYLVRSYCNGSASGGPLSRTVLLQWQQRRAHREHSELPTVWQYAAARRAEGAGGDSVEIAAAILLPLIASCSSRTRSVIVWRYLLCARSSGRSSSPQPITVNSQILKRYRAVQNVTSHKGDINPLKPSGHNIDHQVYHRKVCVCPHSVCTCFV